MLCQAECFQPESVFKLFSPSVCCELQKIPNSVLEQTQEIRLMQDRPIYLTLFGKTVSAEEYCGISKRVNKQELEQSFASLCEYSVHTYLPQIVNGFITIRGGHRIGLGGTAVMQKGEVISLREITSMNIRLARNCQADADNLCRRLFEDGPNSVLIAGEPSAGKTTLLRAIALWLSGKAGGNIRVTIVDERGELASAGLLGNSNVCLDVLQGFPKPVGILQAVRTLSPQVVVCDETGSREETERLTEAMNCGVCFLGSIHAGSLAQLKQKPQYLRLCGVQAVSKVVLLKGATSPAEAKGIYRCMEDGSLETIWEQPNC